MFPPESDEPPNADAIRTLYILIAAIGLVIFIGVEGLLIYSLIRFRARKGRVAAQIHGNTQLEIGWTVGAAAILIFLTVFISPARRRQEPRPVPDRRRGQPDCREHPVRRHRSADPAGRSG